jgi:hypothetical protein
VLLTAHGRGGRGGRRLGTWRKGEFEKKGVWVGWEVE